MYGLLQPKSVVCAKKSDRLSLPEWNEECKAKWNAAHRKSLKGKGRPKSSDCGDPRFFSSVAYRAGWKIEHQPREMSGKFGMVRKVIIDEIPFALKAVVLQECNLSEAKRERDINLRLGSVMFDDADDPRIVRSIHVWDETITTYHDFYDGEPTESDKVQFQLMEYLDVDLWEYMSGNVPKTLEVYRKPMNARQFVGILFDIVNGVRFLHANGILHLDLKAGNVFLVYENGEIRAKIGDFGAACLMRGQPDKNKNFKMLRIRVGGESHKAPELPSGKYNETADIYAMGYIFRDMFFGRTWDGKNRHILRECCGGDYYEKNPFYGAHYSNVLDDVRERLKRCPDWENLIADMTNKISQNRPGMPEIEETLQAIARQISQE